MSFLCLVVIKLLLYGDGDGEGLVVVVFSSSHHGHSNEKFSAADFNTKAPLEVVTSQFRMSETCLF